MYLNKYILLNNSDLVATIFFLGEKKIHFQIFNGSTADVD